MASRTRRWFADSSVSYALAAIALIEYARDHRGEHFEFGPLDAESMRAGGLTVSGEDLDGVAGLLAEIPGLTEYRNGAEEAPVPIA
jgi:hypothetical protein